jgi:two-component system, cell cycle sensor histidine kinase PleC
MGQITAEMIENGRGPTPALSAQRRRNQQHMRAARERLTSAGTGQRTFDLELLRLFARNQRVVISVQAGLVCAWAATLPFWLSPWLLAGWCRRSAPPPSRC